MILAIMIILIISVIIVAAYMFYSNNKGKHIRFNISKREIPSYDEKEDENDESVFSILSKDSIEDKNVKEFFIDENVILVEDNCFLNCTNLSSIKVDENNKNYESKLGVLFSKDMKSLISYPPLKSTSTYFVPQGVETINSHAFVNNNFIKYVIIPTSIQEIKESSFVNCKYINQIVIPESVIEIHPRAFSICPRITVRCYKDSEADRFCKEYFIPCEYLNN